MIAYIIIGVLVVSVIASYYYPKFAIKLGFISTPNHRSLHSEVTPRGAGIVIAIIILTVFIILSRGNYLSHNDFIALFWGGVFVSSIGFLDDRFDISARFRFMMQVFAAIWACIWIGGSPSINLGFSTLELGWVGPIVAVILLVWFYNLFNFIDGIDGMAASSVIFVSLSMVAIISNQDVNGVSLLLLLLGLANIGVLLFNWPPAKLFIGDVGTNFNSFALSAIILISLWGEYPILWTWLILLAYYLTDTTLTTVVRIIKYPKTWYYPHRSHAYQNLARKWDSHLKMLSLVWAINLIWLLPLAIFSFYIPDLGWIFCLIAYIPITYFSLRFGPMYEDQ